MKRKGFTLVELLAVVVILGILITIAVPTANSAIKHAEKTGLYNYSNKIVQEIANNWVLNSNKLKLNNAFDEIDNVSIIMSLDALNIDNNSNYKGYVSYNNTTDEFTSYIYDNKNMIVGLKNNDSRQASEVVKKYDKNVVDTELDPSKICSSQSDTYICLFVTSDGISFDFNYLPGNAVISSFKNINRFYFNSDNAKIGGYDSLHDLIRQLVKPGTTDLIKDIYDFTEVNVNYNKCLDNIVAVEVVDYTPPANAININPVVNGKTSAEAPVYLWYDKPTQTLYFGSSSGYVDLYFIADDLFYLMPNLTKVDFTKFNFHYILSMSKMFALCTKLTEIDMSDKSFDFVTSAYGTFFDCFELKNIDFNGWTTGYLKNVDRMFYGCKKIKTVDVARWDMSGLYSISDMFCNCFEIESIDVSNWDVSKVMDMEGAFQNCLELKYLNVARWNTSRVVYISWIFCGDGELDDLDVSNWDTRNIRDCIEVFCGCEKISRIDMSNWDISNIHSIWHMFGGCANIKEIIFGRTENNNKLVRSSRYNENSETLALFIGGCTSLEYIDMSKFLKLPDETSYGYGNDSLKTFLVSRDFKGEKIKNWPYYNAITKV